MWIQEVFVLDQLNINGSCYTYKLRFTVQSRVCSRRSTFVFRWAENLDGDLKLLSNLAVETFWILTELSFSQKVELTFLVKSLSGL